MNTIHSQIFEEVYNKSLWGPSGDGSGEGSEPEFTRGLCNQLYHIINELEITNILDAPCGAAKWVPQLISKLPVSFKYIGVDVSITALKRAVENLKMFNNKVIAQHDLTIAPIQGSYDLVMCRDCLQHMSYDDIKKVLINISKIDCKWILLGSYINGSNENIETSKNNFLINLMDEPFNMKPDYIFGELHIGTYYNKHLYLYSKTTFVEKMKSIL